MPARGAGRGGAVVPREGVEGVQPGLPFGPPDDAYLPDEAARRATVHISFQLQDCDYCSSLISIKQHQATLLQVSRGFISLL